jgi:chromosome segregation protein
VATAESQKIIQEQERLSQLMRELGEKRGGLEAVLERLKNEANDLEVKKAKVEAKLEEVRNNIQGVEPPKKEDMQGVNINQLKRRVKELEDELAMIGSVNLRAVGMYDELQQQYAEIKEKNEKLYLEKEKIYDLIETIEEKKKAVFYDSFYKVKEHFSQIISELYPSTEGDLTIENEADPFNSGLLVQVKPRGREGMNIDALSGGEKTLTAIAFLMATQEVTPSAFYILDEVDAALDQENVLRLVQFLKNRKQSQFILISHNPETVKHMDSVIGVHMQDGISQVVGVNMRAEAA